MVRKKHALYKNGSDEENREAKRRTEKIEEKFKNNHLKKCLEWNVSRDRYAEELSVSGCSAGV